jgi:hypothetical protein
MFADCKKIQHELGWFIFSAIPLSVTAITVIQAYKPMTKTGSLRYFELWHFRKRLWKHSNRGSVDYQSKKKSIKRHKKWYGYNGGLFFPLLQYIVLSSIIDGQRCVIISKPSIRYVHIYI